MITVYPSSKKRCRISRRRQSLLSDILLSINTEKFLYQNHEFFRFESGSLKRYAGKLCIVLSLIAWNFLAIFSAQKAYGQNIVNNGNKIVINKGAYVVMGGDYINYRGDTANGEVDIDGTILMEGDWSNFAPNKVCVNIESSPDGYVVMRGNDPEFIGGSDPTHFENLVLTKSRKTLNVTRCEVNGVMTLDAILDLNTNRIIMDNKEPQAINYVSKYILSETPPSLGYGEVQWNIESEKKTYAVPFGSGQSNYNDLNLVLNTRTAGIDTLNPLDSIKGNITFATYPTNCYNEEFPVDIHVLDHNPSRVADRYWIIDADYSGKKPDVGILFKYRGEDVDDCNENLDENDLKAMRYNPDLATWNDQPHTGVSDKDNKTVYTDSVSANDFFKAWTLVSEEPEIVIWFPNAFTPNGDGTNDVFAPVMLDLDQYEFEMYIYNRWGELIHECYDVNNFWNGVRDGYTKVSPIGVYTWLFILHLKDGRKMQWVGRCTLVL